MAILKSRLALVGDEARKTSNREQIRTAMLAAQGDPIQAAKALGIIPRAMTQYARDCGLDWPALVAECERLERAEETGENRPTGT